MPFALAIGMTKREFMKSKPIELKPYYTAFKLKKQMRDEEMHRQGFYNLIAFKVVMAHFSAGLASKHSNEEYVKNPFSFIENKENVNENSNEEIAVFEMKQRTNALKNMGLKESPM